MYHKQKESRCFRASADKAHICEEHVKRFRKSGQFYNISLNFTDEQIQKFKSNDIDVELGMDHKEYSRTTKLSKENIVSLSGDFS